MIYIIIPLITTFFAILGELYMEKNHKNKLVVFMGFFVTLILLMFREKTVGADIAPSYVKYFYEFGATSWSELLVGVKNEHGFRILWKTLYAICPHYEFFIVATSIIIVLPIMITYIKHTEDFPLLVVCLYIGLDCFVIMFSGLRQAIAMSICFASYGLIKDKKYFKYLIVVLIAMQFHISAFIGYFVILAYNFKTTRKSAYLVFPLVIICWVFNKQIIQLFIPLMQIVNPDYKQYQIESTGAYASIVMYIGILVYLYLIKSDDKKFVGFRNIMVIITLIQCFAPVIIVAARMSYYFIIFLPWIVTKSVAILKDRYGNKYLWVYTAFLILAMLLFANILIENRLNILPYVTWGD